MAPKRKNAADPGGKNKQVTLSKFFFTSSQGKNASTTTAKNDEEDAFHIIEDEPVKKTSKTSGKNDSCSASTSAGNFSEENPTKSQASNGTHVHSSEKLSKFTFDEDGTKPKEMYQSKNAPQLSTSMSCEIIADSDNEESTQVSTSSALSLFQAKKESSKPKKVSSKSNYTPLEQQFMEIKANHSDTLLFVEVGYKYRFFGEDAEIAAKVLKIFCHLDHNFMTASIPVHRLFVHVRRLVAAGYKVGVVKQTETAHLKAAGDNKGGPFTRKLTALYTKSTLIGEDLDPSVVSEESDSAHDVASNLHPNTYLMCVFEDSKQTDAKKRHIGIICVDPSAGDVFYDSFQDSPTFEELETRITHFCPVEILVSTQASEKLETIASDIASLSSTDDDRIRIEKRKWEDFAHPEAFNKVSDFYGSNNGAQKILALDKVVISCLASVIEYLKEFSLEKVLSAASNFTRFSPKSKYMYLSGNSIRNLEIFNNASDGSEKGSLFWMLNHTRTKMGSRLLRKWVAQPLLDENEIKCRQDAIQEVREGKLEKLKKITDFMTKMPDVEKSLFSAYHGKCSAVEFCNLVKTLTTIKKELKELSQSSANLLQSSLLQEIMREVPDLLHSISEYNSVINEKAARDRDKANLFADCSNFPSVQKRKEQIEEVIESLNNHRRDVRLALKQPGLNFTTVQQVQYLVEVKNKQLSIVPSDWTQINSTKQVSRFHSPFIVKNYRLLNELREQLIIDVTSAWSEFLQQFSGEFIGYKRAIQYLATLDCLMSLAKTGSQDAFCRPLIDKDSRGIDIEDGRHPIIDALKSDQDQYVPNGTLLKGDGTRVMVVSGPNMGGKSSYIRQVALISILAQIGSYVPARSARIGIIDAIYTRMGASDDLFKGQSTFMLELQEASHIISNATDRSLVILDELGRGTSTHDGVAIAYATLQHFITKCQCLVLFVTHFPLMSEFQETYPEQVKNYHMAFMVNDSSEDSFDTITFLYQLTEGAARKSYGMNVAKLAEIPENILMQASSKSIELEKAVNQRVSNLIEFSKMWNTEEKGIQEAIINVKNADS